MINLSNIPIELQSYSNWVVGNPQKIPFDPKTSNKAKADNPDTWGTFEQATSLHESQPDKYPTVGFEINESPFTAIDIDHCRDPQTGEIAVWAQEIITRVNSYTEISPSGSGIRIFVTAGDQFPSVNRKKGGLGESGQGAVEIASGGNGKGKYFSVTGDHLEGTPTWICHRPAELRQVFDQYFPEKAPESVSEVKASNTLADDEILQRAGKVRNGEAFQRLFSGDWSGHASHSEADMSLCCHLAFWSGNNADQINRLFRQSGLMRAKWDREDYRTQTIQKAIENTTETYTPPKPKEEKEPTNNADTADAPKPETKDPTDPLRYFKTGAELQEMDIVVSWLIEDLIPDASITTVIGPAGYGKSTVCLNLANAIDRGIPWLGRETIAKPVYILDFENPLAVNVERARSLNLAGVLIWHTSAEIAPPRIDSPEYVMYKKLPPGLIVVDGHRASQRGDENSSQDTGLVMERWKELRDLGFTIVLIHHTQKANAEVFRGSQALIDQADHCLYFYPVRQLGSDDPVDAEDPDAMTYFLGTKDKTRYKACKLYLRRAGEGRFIQAENPDNEKMAAIREILKTHGNMVQKDLIKTAQDELGYSKAQIRRVLKKGESTMWKVTKGEKNSRTYQFSSYPPL
jgi:hypothetical protein